MNGLFLRINISKMVKLHLINYHCILFKGKICYNRETIPFLLNSLLTECPYTKSWLAEILKSNKGLIIWDAWKGGMKYIWCIPRGNWYFILIFLFFKGYSFFSSAETYLTKLPLSCRIRGKVINTGWTLGKANGIGFTIKIFFCNKD